ncbi:nucleoprotein TPR isoform X2 [Chrysoperla carnea]|uniref:nucleoprotein TPR isoform X2 n=1 Tax=Chrysoperla carnea TaxID=189513 RepID=UPI001D07361F|nr:nucleoprotein TPR isoform X2 [Chrysoperla carnea]
MESASKNIVKEALTEDEIQQIPESLVKKIDEYFDREFGEYLTAKAIYETGRSKSEQQIQELNNQLTEFKEKYELEKSNLEAATQNISQLENQVEQLRHDISKLNESRQQAEHNAAEFRRQRDEAVDERDSMQAMLERRTTELERLQTDFKSLSEQLQAAITAKCEVLAKSEEVESMKTNLEFREKRMEQERALLNNQIQNLTEDLNKRVNELLQIRRENTTRLIALQTALDTKTEELNSAKESIKTLTESNNEMTTKYETLVERYKEQRDAENRYQDSFTQELQAQTKLAQLYKDMSEENQAQINQLTEAVSELQRLLKEHKEQQEILETEHKELQLTYEETVTKKNECIELLKKELEDANDILKSTREQKLENVIESLAPSAAATSRLIKPGMSLTQIYSQYVSASEEVIIKDAEIRRLNTYIEAIVKELDEKAPVLRKQREDYEMAIENVSELSKQNDLLTSELHRLQKEYAEAHKTASHACRENERLKSERGDLGRQVCYLLKEIEELRSASVSSHDNDMNTSDYHSSSDIISKRLVTFSNIEELQATNEKLLALVRELSSKQEEAEGVTPAEVAELRNKLTEMRENQADLLQNQERQTKMLSALIRQRDSYKKMYQNAMKMPVDDLDESVNLEEMEVVESVQKSTPKKVSEQVQQPIVQQIDVSKYTNEIEELKKKLEDSEKLLRTLQQEYENYQKEKSTNETMVSEQLDALRTENRNIIQANCKLNAVIEYKDEQIKISKSNIDILRKQIASLEKKNNTYSNIITKHEQSSKHLTDEVLNAQSKLSRAEVLLDNIRQENKLLKDSESRLLRERDALQREAHGQSLLLNNLESIKASFERSEAEGKIRLEQRLDETSRECSALRRRLQEEQDRFREYSTVLERQTQAAKDRMEEEKGQADKLRKELTSLREELQEKLNLIDELNKKMKHNIIHDSNPLHEQIRGLEREVGDAKSEIQALQQQLKSAKLQAEQYCNVSENAEKELRELNETYQQYKTDMETRLQAQSKTEDELRRKIAHYEQELNRHTVGHRDTANDLRNQLMKTKDELSSTNEELQNLKVELEVSKLEIIRLNECIQETEDKYAREMIHHSADIQSLAAIKEEVARINKERNELIQNRDEAINALEVSKASWLKQEEAIAAEKKEIQIRLEEVEKQNSILHNQLDALSTQLSISHAQHPAGPGDAAADSSSGDISMNKSFNEDESKSADKLLQIIKYLRREKDVLIAKFDILQAENVRVRSQLDITNKQLEEAKLSETTARTKSDADVVTIAKHNEVLRKVETLNAITDSNRVLREERDTLLTKISELSERTNRLETELAPLQEQNRELTMKYEAALIDITSLKAEATRWRQRANTLIERSNKATPDDWRRLQQERENLTKLVMSQKEEVKKATEAKTKVEQQLAVVQKQLTLQNEQIKKLNEELSNIKQSNTKLQQEFEEQKIALTKANEENAKLNEDITNKTKEHKALMSKYVSVRALARKYKEQVEEESKQAAAAAAAAAEPQPVPPEVQEQYREEGRRELTERVSNMEKAHNDLVQELNGQVTSTQEEMAKLRKENETLKLNANAKYERSQNVLRSAKSKIQTLNEQNDQYCKEINELRSRIENQDDSKDSRIATIKSQYETKIARLEKEKTECLNERKVESEKAKRDIEALNQHVSQLQRQIGQLGGSKPSTSSGSVEKPTSVPPTANIKPMAGQTSQSVSVVPRRTGETPFASIRPISMPQRSVAMLFPTNVNASTSGTAAVAVPPQQQVVHTTGNSSIEALSSSPTSSHTDYMPATSSASPAVQSIRQIAVPPTQQATVTIGMGSSCEDPPSAAESTQDMEAEADRDSQQTTSQQTQQAVALVLPRVEQQSEHEQPQAAEQSHSSSSSSLIVASSQPASSSNTVTTSQAGLKRTRETEGDSSTSSAQDEQQNNSQPQAKRTRIQQVITESGSTEVEYQVPTSSQRDQEDDVICVDSDDDDDDEEEEEEEEGPDDGVEVLDDPDDGPYEEGENGEECYEAEGLSYDNDQEITESYDDAECQAMEEDQVQENDNNEVEVIEENRNADGGASQSTSSTGTSSTTTLAQNQGGAQSEAISSASSGETASSQASSQPASSNQTTYALRGRNITPLARQNQMILGHGFEESGDDGIVPSTPTLYVPRRTDGFGEAVSSPHVPSGGRFTFNDPPATTGRNTISNVEQGQTEQSEELRDPLEDTGTGRSVPTTPLQVSPQGDVPPNENTLTANVNNEEINASESNVGDSTSSNQEANALANIPEITISNVQTLSETTVGDTQTSQEKSNEEEQMAPPQDVAGPSGEVTNTLNVDAEADEGTDGVSSEGEKPIPVEDAEMEEGREAEASQSPSSNTRGQRVNNVRSSYRNTRSRGTPSRPIPIIWNDQQNRASGSRGQGGFQRAQRGRRNVRRAQQNNYMRY